MSALRGWDGFWGTGESWVGGAGGGSSESIKVHFKVIHHASQRRNSTYCSFVFLQCVYLFVCVHKYHTAKKIIIIIIITNNSTKEKKEEKENPQNIILFLITRMNQVQ